MLESSVERILSLLTPNDVVLDIGGWACPFNRANYVIDAEPFETRGYYSTIGRPASQGGSTEYFTKGTWIQRDVCERTPYPFKDKEIDFVTCSHVLEDIRDPLWVCSERVRIAKRGYIEVPSRLAESSRGWESPRTAGLTHHRWLIDFKDSSPQITFLMKHHLIHSERRFSFPPSFFRSLGPDQMVSTYFWDHTFEFSEQSIHGLSGVASELEGYVSRRYRYPVWQLATDRFVARASRQLDRIVRRLS